jgi:hypothetical protein
MFYNDLILASGGALKTMASDDPAMGRLGGYLVRFGSDTETDLAGEFFTGETYFGAQLAATGKAILDGTLNHRIPMITDDMPPEHQKIMERLAVKFLPPVEVTKDEQGLFAEIVFDLADEYQKMLFDMGVKGVWKWSSGSAEHVVDTADSGQILSWPLIEAGITPSPAEFRDSNRLIPLKIYAERQLAESEPELGAAKRFDAMLLEEFLEALL